MAEFDITSVADTVQPLEACSVPHDSDGGDAAPSDIRGAASGDAPRKDGLCLIHCAASGDAPRKDDRCVGKRTISCDNCGAAPDRKKLF